MKAGRGIRFNIINLLRLHDMTSADLARSTGIDPAVISKYLNGERKISDKNLKLISRCFCVSPELLLFGDFTEANSINPNPKSFADNYNLIFPLFSNEEAEKDPDFQRAYTAQLKTFELARDPDSDPADIDFENGMEGYEKASKNEVIRAECSANLLAGLLFSMYLLSMVRFFSNGWEAIPAMLKKYFQKNWPEGEWEINLGQEELEGFEKEFRELINDPEYYTKFTDLLYVLKHRDGWEDLADYYICIQYFLGLVGNAFSYEQNQSIGIELLLIHQACGNKYADRFVTEFLDPLVDC